MRKKILMSALRLMKNKGIPLTKINIQKTVYFLRELGVPLRYKYEPYIYGPYSSELNSELTDLTIWDNLSLSGNQYSFSDDEKHIETIDEDYIKQLSTSIDAFISVLDGNYDFHSMEVTGTVIYCAQALRSAGMVPSEPNVLTEFKNWKGTKYGDDVIKAAFAKIHPLLN